MADGNGHKIDRNAGLSDGERAALIPTDGERAAWIPTDGQEAARTLNDGQEAARTATDGEIAAALRRSGLSLEQFDKIMKKAKDTVQTPGQEATLPTRAYFTTPDNTDKQKNQGKGK